MRVIVGKDVSRELVGSKDVVIEYQGASDLADDDLPAVDAIVGQLLAFFRCLRERLYPDSPSESGIIQRVVQSFALHSPAI